MKFRLVYHGSLAVLIGGAAAMSLLVVMILIADDSMRRHVSLTAVLEATALSLAAALWGGWNYRPGRRVQQVARYGYWTAAALAVGILPLVLSFDANLFAMPSFLMFGWPLLSAVLLGIVCLMIPARRRYFAASLLLGIGLMFMILLMLAG